MEISWEGKNFHPPVKEWEDSRIQAAHTMRFDLKTNGYGELAKKVTEEVLRARQLLDLYSLSLLLVRCQRKKNKNGFAFLVIIFCATAFYFGCLENRDISLRNEMGLRF